MDLWQFLDHREQEILKQSKALERELHELRKVRFSLTSMEENVADRAERLTIKDMIRSVLTRFPAGGTADQIVTWIDHFHGVVVPKTSLSPQLSRLKADGEVSLHEELGLWVIVSAHTRLRL